jgi:hypothetical protein
LRVQVIEGLAGSSEHDSAPLEDESEHVRGLKKKKESTKKKIKFSIDVWVGDK